MMDGLGGVLISESAVCIFSRDLRVIGVCSAGMIGVDVFLREGHDPVELKVEVLKISIHC